MSLYLIPGLEKIQGHRTEQSTHCAMGGTQFGKKKKGIQFGDYVGKHVSHHVGHHNVILKLCEGSETLTELKS